MRAVLVRAFGDDPAIARIEECDSSPLGPEDVRVAVRAAAVGFADLLVMSGRYQLLAPLPFTPGQDAAGTVTEVGSRVRTVEPGDRVLLHLAHGGYASEVCTNASRAFRIPHAVSFVDAAAMGLTYPTAWFALVERAQLQAGETVLVNGAGGGVGLAAVQIAKALGAKVFAAVSSTDKADAVRAAGANAVIDVATPDSLASLREQVYAANVGHGVDVVIDPVGGDAFDASLRALAWCGRAVTVGFASGRIPTVKSNYLLVKNIAVLGLQITDYQSREPQRFAEAHAELMRLNTVGAVRPHVMMELPLERFADGLRLVAARKAVGKIVLTIEEDVP
jgi:NADPH2:quinone reductase